MEKINTWRNKANNDKKRKQKQMEIMMQSLDLIGFPFNLALLGENNSKRCLPFQSKSQG